MQLDSLGSITNSELPRTTPCCILSRCTDRVMVRLIRTKIGRTALAVLTWAGSLSNPKARTFRLANLSSKDVAKEMEKLFGFSVHGIEFYKLMTYDNIPVYIRGELHDDPENFNVVINLGNKNCVLGLEGFVRDPILEREMISYNIPIKYREGYHYGLEDELVTRAARCPLLVVISVGTLH